MPFKLIETIEKGQKKLCVVPSSWESKGVLKWPRKRLDVNKLVKDEHSKPLDNWSSSICSVKRLSLSSYEEAITELDLMVQNSDTEVDNATETSHTIDTNNINFNTLASQLVTSQPKASSMSSTGTSSIPILPEATTAAQYVLQYVEEPELATISVDTHQNAFETQTQNNIDLNQIEIYLKLILENQYNMIHKINVLTDNQKKIFQKLASLSVQIDDGFSNCNQTKNTDVVTLGESNPFYSEPFAIKPIENIKELEEFESLLLDKKQKHKLLKQYSFVCSQSDGKGATCAYKILDMFFSREFLCKCSWTGGSRNSNEVKVGLKRYKNILNFYYELVRSWDKTYTSESHENFFKIVLKNSVKRKLSKNERASTKRKRTKKAALKNKNVTKSPSPGPSTRIEPDEENQDKNETEMDTSVKETINQNAINEEEMTEEEEDSLC